MVKSHLKNRMALAALTFCLVHALAISSGCKKKQRPEDAQQTVTPQKTEHIAAPEPSERIEKIDTSKKIGLRILYAGLPNTERTKDFVEFLTTHFERVETADYNSFTGSLPADFDVAIIDHDGVDVRAPTPTISRTYSRATVTMGVPGAHICSRLSLKTAYL